MARIRRNETSLSRHWSVAGDHSHRDHGSGRTDAVLSSNTTWRYLKGTQEASTPDTTVWRTAAFDDHAWATGEAPFSYGEFGIAGGTRLEDMQNSYSTLFLRTSFNVANPDQVTALELVAVCDDGFLAWINGQPVASLRPPTGTPRFDSLAGDNAPEPVGFAPYPIADPQQVLVPGANVLAVQVFNVSLGSSDIVFDAALTATLSHAGPPTVSSVLPEPGLVSALNSITVTFNEPVAGVAAEHFLINDQPAASVVGSGTTYTFTFPQPAYGSVQIRWSTFHTIQDLETPPQRFDLASPGSNWSYELLDPVGPSVLIRQPPPLLTVSALSQIEVTFDKAVLGVDAADLLVNGAPATNVTGIGAGPYLFEFIPAAPGAVLVTWADTNGIVSDAVVPHPLAGNSWSYTVDPPASASGAGDHRVHGRQPHRLPRRRSRPGRLDRNPQPRRRAGGPSGLVAFRRP